MINRVTSGMTNAAPRFLALITNDVRLQYRNGIYAAYGFVILFYIGALNFAGNYLPSWVPALVIYTDPAVVGFFFLGALLMLEKAENIRTALAISPVAPADYFWSKTLSLSTMALIAVAIITPFLHQQVNWPLLLITTALTSITALGIGIPIALRFKTVTGYLMGSAAILTPIIAPGFIAFLDNMPFWAIVLPPASQLRLVLVATDAQNATIWELMSMLLVLTITATTCAWWALRVLKGELGRK